MTKTKTLSAVLAVIISLLMVATALAPVTADASADRAANTFADRAANTLPKVKTVKIVKKTPTLVQLRWSKVKGAKKYQIAYKVKGAKKYKVRYAKGTSKVIKGLTRNRKYCVKIRGINGSRKGAFSKAILFKTPKKLSRKWKVGKQDIDMVEPNWRP